MNQSLQPSKYFNYIYSDFAGPYLITRKGHQFYFGVQDVATTSF